MRPIGIGEVHRRIIAKAILWILSTDIEDAAGPLQVCAGQTGGCEAAIHAMRQIFAESTTEGVLLVDAENAFNSVNRIAALHNIEVICPSFSKVLINTYRNSIRQVIPGSGEITSCEGTTQGDPLAMAMYALALSPLIKQLQGLHPQTKQVWYADDATGAGTCEHLMQWWDSISLLGPKYGYFPKSSKTFLVVKPDFEEKAKLVFEGTNVNITSRGHRHLGAVIGSTEYREEFVNEKIKGWCDEIRSLAEIAETDPHSAYSAFTHGMVSRWSFLTRTIPDISDLMLPLEEVIHQYLIPALCNRPPSSSTERRIFEQPARLGGLGIANPGRSSQMAFRSSSNVTAPLVKAIISQDMNAGVDLEVILDAKKTTREANRLIEICRASDLNTDLDTRDDYLACPKRRGPRHG